MCIVLLKLHALLHLLGHGMFECNTPKLGFLGLLSVDISYKVCIQGLYIYRVKKRFRVWRGCANKLTLLALAAMRCDLDVIVSRLADLKVPKDTRLKNMFREDLM